MTTLRNTQALIAIAICLTGPTTTAFAQQPVVQPAAPDKITIEVVAEDKQGHPVRGLQAQDFTVVDNGQPQTILDFHAIDPTQDPNALHILIVMDMINTGFDAVARQREQLGEYLKQDQGKLSYPTSIAVMSEKGLKIMNGYTVDGHQLLAEFQKSGTDLRAIGRDAGFYGAAERMQLSLGQISQIAAVEATHPGRKLVLVLSPGWPMLAGAGVEEDMKQRAWVFNGIVQLTQGLREAHIALYSLDPFDLGRTNPFYYQSYLKGIKRVDNAEYPDLALQVIAEHSGGRAITNGHDVLGDLNTAIRDAGPYYQLTIQAPSTDHHNEYHELKFRLDKPDLTARGPAAYYADTQPLNGSKNIVKPF